ncbi:hypothetical protein K32_45660 [Kaistia sp. 32K]|uniref:DUF3833 family protein n=1 Tax=Kaistia sp. 32K TaxID=2795690 RepID=UPI0019158A68|nr:DUF3833 family protein [Kaistia sp. 32K]BCP55949.1 hypothetical protein K32_45660 [Kaistia sp. 32K]
MKIALRLAGLVLLLACGAGGPTIAAGQTLEEAFRGQATGVGRFKSRLAGVDRGFVVTTNGRRSGEDFILDQVFRFDNGSLDRRTWRFRRTGPDTYVGTRQDVVGEAAVRVEDDRIRMSYDLITRGRDGGKLQLHFEDTIRRTGRNTITNNGVISTLGMKVGSVDVTFKRQKFGRGRAEETARR